MTQLVAPQQKIQTVRTLLERSKQQIATALPAHLKADRMLRVAMTAIQKNPRLLDCTEISLVGAIIQASQLGLEPDGVLGRAYLIPRRNNRKGVTEAHFQPGYKGLMDLARRSDEVEGFAAEVVYAGDEFEYALGLQPFLRHVPKEETEDVEKVTHVYAIAWLRKGPPAFKVMTRARIEAHRKQYSRAGDDEDSAWRTAWTEMAKKTVIIALTKYLPASIENLQKAAALAEHDQAGLPQDLATLVPAGLMSEPTSGLDALTERLEQEHGVAAPPEAAPPAPEPPAALPPSPPEPKAPVPPNMEAQRSLLLGKVTDLRTKVLRDDEKTWRYLTDQHLGGIAISRADLAQLTDLCGALQAIEKKQTAAREAAKRAKQA